ncbi:carboxypeptidase-like regulatory domain-containing protein [Ekhidna sp.]
MKKFLPIALLFLSFYGFSQRDYLYGEVTDLNSSDPVIGAHIRNLSAGLITNTNENGRFKIPVQVGDSLVVTFVGYESIYYTLEDLKDSIHFELVQMTTQLGEVEVNVFPEYSRFKDLIIETQPMDSSLVVFGLDAIPLDAYEVAANEMKIKPNNYQAPTIGIGFDLGGLTKKGKEKKKLNKILAQQELERSAFRKFNRDWVSQETKLKGDELTDFIAYCQFSTEYLVETTLFEIHKKMMALLDEFQAGKKRKRKDNFNPGAQITKDVKYYIG